MMTELQLQAKWNMSFPGTSVTEDQAGLWLSIHDDETLRRTFVATKNKADRTPGMSAEYLIRYFSKTANNIKARKAIAAGMVQAVR